MADKKDSELPSASTPVGTEIVTGVQSATSVSFTIAQIALLSKTLAELNTQVSDATLVDTGDSRFSDARTPTSHSIAGAEHSADTLANLNTKISDATLIDTADSRLSDARTPTTHDLDSHAACTLSELSALVTDAVLARTDAAQSFTGLQTIASMSMGGHTINDVLISTDGASTSDSVFATPGWIDANIGGGGGVTALSVTNIDDPSTELNAIAGSAKGDLRLCYQTVAGKDEWTMYAYDNADSDLESVPYTVDGSSGMWSAIGGRYVSGPSTFSGEVHFTGTDKVFLDTDKDTYLWPILDDDLRLYVGAASVARFTASEITLSKNLKVESQLNHDGTTVGFYGASPVAQQTGVAVTASAIHAALVSLGLITA